MLNTITFTGNQATSGGGVYNHYHSNPMLTNITFSGNHADLFGGGMYNYNLSSPILVSVTFSTNQAAYMGGGLCNDNESSPTLINVTFSGNQTIEGDGGGMYNYQSNPVLNNVRFSGNRARFSGGGMINNNNSPALINVTFSSNQADRGGGLFNYASSNPMLVNSILWGDSAGTSGPEIYNDSSSAPIVTYTDVQLASGIYTGTANLNVDPQFAVPIPAALAPITTGNYRLRYGSSAIDAGNNLSVTVATDLDGNPRIRDSVVDLGAYETQVFLVVGMTGTGDGTVTSAPAAIDCPSGPCGMYFATGTVVTLTATPLPASIFTGWSGDVVTTTNWLTLTMSATRQVTVTFSSYQIFLPMTIRSGL